MPASASSLAVPPVERISTPRAASARANSTRPRLSLTLSSARLISGIELLHVDARHPLAHAGQHLVRDRLAPPRELVRAHPARPVLLADHHDFVADRDPRH